MARGDLREDIVAGEGNRDPFADFLGELVELYGFEVFAWVLMSSHPAFAQSYGGRAAIWYPGCRSRTTFARRWGFAVLLLRRAHIPAMIIRLLVTGGLNDRMVRFWHTNQ